LEDSQYAVLQRLAAISGAAETNHNVIDSDQESDDSVAILDDDDPDGDDDPAWCAYFTEPKYLADLGIARARLRPIIHHALSPQQAPTPS